MNYRITNKQIGNPLLVKLLKRLTYIFGRMGREFYVIGATARDLICLQLNINTSNRKTRDLDIAIAIPDWASFEEIKAALIADGFEKSTIMHQRFYCEGYEVDVVPYGDIVKADDCIYWPPEEDIAMSVRGFDNVLSEAVIIDIDDECIIKIASLHGLFILKLNAWFDRHIADNRDAEDMSFIIANYFIASINREMPPEVFEWEVFDEYVAGAYWLAHDLRELLDDELATYYKNKILGEIDQAERSILINQMLESTYGLSFEQARNAWLRITEVLGQ